MDVRLPDGTIIKNVPDGTTKADLVSKLKGNGMAVPSEWLEAAPKVEATADQRLLASAPMRFAKGMKDGIDGGAQFLSRTFDTISKAMPGGAVVNAAFGSPSALANRAADAIGGAGTFAGDVLGIKGATPQQLDTEVQRSNAEYEAARKATGQTGVDAMRFAGNVVSPANAIPARVVAPLRVGAPVATLAKQGAVGGAAGAAIQPVMGGNYWGEKTGQVAAGAAAGGVLTPLMSRAAESIARTVSEKLRGGAIRTPEAIQYEIKASMAQDDIDVGQIPKQVMDKLTAEVQLAMKSGQEVDAPAILRKLDFERVGVKPLLGQITRDPTQFTREQNLRGIQGVGEPIANRLNEQSAQIAGRFRRATTGAKNPYEAGQTLVASLQAKNQAMESDVRSAYRAFRESTGKDLEVPLQELAQDYAATLRDFGDTIPSAVRGQFEGLGLLSGKQLKLLTIDDAERLIKTINKNYDPMNKPAARAMDELRGHVQNAILSVTDSGAGMEAAALANMARDTARQRFSAIESTPALKAAINGAEPDDFVKKYVIGGKVRELNKLAEMVGPEGQKTMQQQMLKYLEKKAFGANAAGDGSGRQASFNQELQSIGRNKLAAILGEQQADDLFAVGRVMAYIQQQPAGSAVNNSNTGAAVANVLSKIAGTVKGAPYISDFVVKPVTAYRERGEVSNALAAALAKKPAELDAQTIGQLNRLLAPLPVASGAALGYSVR